MSGVRTLASTLRTLLIALSAVLLLSVAALAGFRAWLGTAGGERWLTRQVLQQANERLTGKLDVETARLVGWNTIELEGVRLLDRQDEELARLSHLTVTIRLRSLLDQEIILPSIRGEGLVADVAPDAEGDYPLLEALQPVDADPEAEDGWPVEVHDARVEIDRLVWRTSAGEPPSFVATDGAVTARVDGREGVWAFDGAVQLELELPAEGEASGTFAGRYADDRLDVKELVLVLPGGIRIEAESNGTEQSAGGSPPDAHPASAQRTLLERLRVRATLPADGLVPWNGPLLAGPIEITALLRFDGPRIAFDAEAFPPGPGRILAEGWYEGGEPGTFSGVLDARGIDPARILPDAPAGRVWAAALLSGAMAFPPNAAARGSVWLADSRIGEEHVGPGEVRFQLAGEEIRVSHLDLALAGARVVGQLRAGGERPPTGSLRADVVDLAPVSRLASAMGLDAPVLQGTLELDASARGEGDDREILIRAWSPRLEVEEQRFREVDLRASQRGKQFSIDGRLVGDFGPMMIAARAESEEPDTLVLDRFDFDVREMFWSLERRATVAWTDERLTLADLVLQGPGRLAIDADLPRPDVGFEGALIGVLRLENFDLSTLQTFVPDLRPTGLMDTRLRLAGTVDAPVVHGSIATEDASIAESPPISADLTLDLAAGRMGLGGWMLLAGHGLLRVESELERQRAGSLWTTEGLLGAMGRAQVEVPAMDLGALAIAGAVPAGTEGTLSGSVEILGPVARPEVHADLVLKRLELRDPAPIVLPPTEVSLRLDSNAESIELVGRVESEGSPPLRMRLFTGMPFIDLIQAERPERAPIGGWVELDPGPLDIPATQVTAAHAAARADVGGTLGSPEFEVAGAARALVLRDMPIGDLELTASIGPRRWAGTLRLQTDDDGWLLAKTELPPPGVEQPWEVVIEAQQAQLGFLSLLPALRIVDRGVADGRLIARDTPRGPEFAGVLEVGFANLLIEETGLFQNVELQLLGEGTALRVTRLHAAARDGRIDVNGRVAWSGDRWNLDLVADADRFPVPTPARPTGEVTTRTTVSLTQQERLVTGDVRLTPGEVRLPDGPPERPLHPVTLPPDYRVHRPGRPVRDEPTIWERWLAEYRAEIGLHVPRNFWLRGDMATVELQSDATARWDGSRLALGGRLDVLRGFIVVMGRRFTVEELGLAFTGEPVIDPVLEGRLIFVQRDVRVELLLGGRMRSPEVRFQSDPPMDETEIALLIATGRGAAAGGPGGVAGAAAGFALNWVASEVRQALAAALPIDVLAIELGPYGLAQRIEAGTYVTPSLFVSFVHNMFAQPMENSNEVQAEVYISPRLSLRTRFGDRQAGGARLMYERRFRSPSQREAGEDEEETAAPPGPPAPATPAPPPG